MPPNHERASDVVRNVLGKPPVAHWDDEAGVWVDVVEDLNEQDARREEVARLNRIGGPPEDILLHAGDFIEDRLIPGTQGADPEATATEQIELMMKMRREANEPPPADPKRYQPMPCSCIMTPDGDIPHVLNHQRLIDDIETVLGLNDWYEVQTKLRRMRDSLREGTK